jgi:hypothetical protein
MTENQKKFIIQTFLSNTQCSSFQHGKVYAKNLSKEDKRLFEENKPDFVKAFHARLESLKDTYNQEVSEEDHIKNIEKFREGLSRDFPTILNGGRMRFGIAQKAVNLYLKFLWCLGDIEEPPHCTIDGIVLTGVKSKIKWTELDCLEEYKGIIELIKTKAGNKSIAEWELEFWQSIRDK